ncbi:MAG TPA: paraquat-inducible protein A [Opitutaceae bacterium]
MATNFRLTCYLCGHEHRAVRLSPGQKAVCVRCDAVLAKGSRLGPDTALAFSLTGLILSVPAIFLPFIAAGKLGDLRISRVLTGVGGFWDRGLAGTGTLVLLCGCVLPLALLASLAVLHAPARLGFRQRTDFGSLYRAARILEHWAIPEVQVLAVLVALMKLGSLVDVTIGPGFWCYCGMAVSLLVAEHSFDFDTTSPFPAAAENAPEAAP